MHEDRDACLRAVAGRDPRFDGQFVSAVVTTGIYCRPSCPARPKGENLVFHPHPVSAQAAGFRACLRCRPDAVPGSPAWDLRADLVGRAMQLIGDGVIDREGVSGLAARLGYSCRQVERALRAELGAGPLAVARAARAHTARLLLTSTALPVADVAFAAGFGSVRQCNDTVRAVFAVSPTALRARAHEAPDEAATSGHLVLRLPFRRPLLPDNLFGHLVATGVPGVEEWRDGAYRRTLRLPRGPGIVALTPPSDGDVAVTCRLSLTDLGDLPVALARSRRLLDLDADPLAVDTVLAEDDALAPLVAAAPGRRVPRAVDGAELALRTVLGQQVSTAAARTHAARLVDALGDPVADPAGGLTHLFPVPAAVADADPESLAMPAARRRALLGLARALTDGDLDLDGGADRTRTRAALLALPGIGPWTVETVAMRALGDPDAFLPTDLGIVAAARALGLPAGRELVTRSAGWSPYRAYAVQHLWGVLEHPVNSLPDSAAEKDAA